MPKILSVQRIASAARLCRLTDRCLRDAVERGDVPHVLTADGLPLVRIEDVQKFANRTYTRGRPRKKIT